jgi:pyruvate dehydrogenase E2 component (dihydrolipoamide acetyltransferase)
MTIFNLPDLGEGLPDAIIREWHVKVGDTIEVDATMVSMETAKALVEVPAPFSGTVVKRFGEADDTILTGSPLIELMPLATDTTEATHTASTPSPAGSDEGTVVGQIETTHTVTEAPSLPLTGEVTASVSPGVYALARRLGVDLGVFPPGEQVTAAMVHAQAPNQAATAQVAKPAAEPLPAGALPLSGPRQAMVHSMTHSHATVVPVTLCDEVDITHFEKKDKITLRVIRALVAACQAEPMLNAAFHPEHMAYVPQSTVNLGLAIDTPHGLYVPVIQEVNALDDEALMARIHTLKEQAFDKRIPQADLHGATLTLSNFGTLAGRFATPVVIPPMISIVGIGKTHAGVKFVKGTAVESRLLPISVSADHRAVTGGEISRFLSALMDHLR